MSDGESEIMDEWRRTREIKAAGPYERSELDAFSETLRTTVRRIRAARVELENTLSAIKEARGMMVITPTLTDAERDLLDTLRRSEHLLPHGAKIIGGLLKRMK